MPRRSQSVFRNAFVISATREQVSAFIDMDVDGAGEAIDRLDGRRWNGRKLRIAKSEFHIEEQVAEAFPVCIQTKRVGNGAAFGAFQYEIQGV